MPAAISPWPHECPAPTPRLEQPLSVSPVNWANITGVSDQQIEAYEMRQPWDPKPTTFAFVAENTQFKRTDGAPPTEEGVRK